MKEGGNVELEADNVMEGDSIGEVSRGLSVENWPLFWPVAIGGEVAEEVVGGSGFFVRGREKSSRDGSGSIGVELISVVKESTGEDEEGGGLVESKLVSGPVGTLGQESAVRLVSLQRKLSSLSVDMNILKDVFS